MFNLVRKKIIIKEYNEILYYSDMKVFLNFIINNNKTNSFFFLIHSNKN